MTPSCLNRILNVKIQVGFRRLWRRGGEWSHASTTAKAGRVRGVAYLPGADTGPTKPAVSFQIEVDRGVWGLGNNYQFPLVPPQVSLRIWGGSERVAHFRPKRPWWHHAFFAILAKKIECLENAWSCSGALLDNPQYKFKIRFGHLDSFCRKWRFWTSAREVGNLSSTQRAPPRSEGGLLQILWTRLTYTICLCSVLILWLAQLCKVNKRSS